MKPGARFQVGEGTTQTFSRTSRDARSFPETEPPYPTLGEIAVYVTCALCVVVMLGIFAFEYFTTGRL